MKNQQVFFLIIILFLVAACSQTTKRAKDFTQSPDKISLDEYEKNKVLHFYSPPKDSLKRKAAAFLLEHISAHYSDENSISKEIEKRYGKIKKKTYVESYETFSSVLESIPGQAFVFSE